jgi:hypothetical protein
MEYLESELVWKWKLEQGVERGRRPTCEVYDEDSGGVSDF